MSTIQALKCGIGGITKPCIGDTDPRYDPKATYDLKSQTAYYKNLLPKGSNTGLFSGLSYIYNEEGIPSKNIVVPGLEALGNFSYFPAPIFTNVTVYGSRLIQTDYFISKSTTMGGPGLLNALEVLHTSTFEKNGQAQMIANTVVTGGYQMLKDGDIITSTSNETAELYSRREDQLRQASYVVHEGTLSSVETAYRIYDGQPEFWYMRRQTQTMKSESEWLREFEAALDDAGVLSAASAGAFGLPLDLAKPSIPINERQCAQADQNLCPTEEMWQKKDPYFNQSPYVEPDGILTGGFIAAVIVSSIIIAAAIFYFINRTLMMKQQERLQVAFRKAVSKQISGGLKDDLSPDQLLKLYKKVDADGNGTISKDELKQLINENGLGDLSDKDFNVMFSTIDLDDNKALSFTEFTAFFASLPSSDSFEDS